MPTPCYRTFNLLIFVLSLLILAELVVVVYQNWNWTGISLPGYANASAQPAGQGTVSDQPFASFMMPLANLPSEQLADFHAGKALAHQPWVKAPSSTTARDGLGPLYNARTCLACHINGGRGLMPVSAKHEHFSHFLRLSIPGQTPEGAPLPEPTYGDQLQLQSTALAHQLRQVAPVFAPEDVKPEAKLRIDWQLIRFQYPDGQTLELRSPQLLLSDWSSGGLHPQAMMSLRNAPPILGVGLIEAIPQAALDALADPQDANQDGISGKVNWVWDYEQKITRPGRFGLKANQVSVRAQTAAALHGDMGISNPIFPTQPCTEQQPQCLQQINGAEQDGLEINESLLSLMVNFTRNLSVPKRRNPTDVQVLAGQKLFEQVGCAACHHPQFVTGQVKDFPHLSEQTIWPYSDFLLHDMGQGLADFRPDFFATGQEWRTAPLWGVGLSQKVNGAKNFLHDGRARSIEEAVVWHGGEAAKAQHAFLALTAEQRAALLAFVEDL